MAHLLVNRLTKITMLTLRSLRFFNGDLTVSIQSTIKLILLISLWILFTSCKTVVTKPSATQEIPRISSMSAIMDAMDQADWVIFDIDHTLLEATTEYCHSNWFYDQYEDAIARGIPEQVALNALLPSWEQSQKNCTVKPVEAITPALVKKIQAGGKYVMALTTRSKTIASDTIAQLASLGIDFSTSAPITDTRALSHGAYIKNGIVFTTEFTTKGDVLKEYVTLASSKPKTIVFVDDSMRNLISVKTVLGETMMVHAFHYPLVVRSLPRWNKERATRIWEQHHGKIVYDVAPKIK